MFPTIVTTQPLAVPAVGAVLSIALLVSLVLLACMVDRPRRRRGRRDRWRRFAASWGLEGREAPRLPGKMLRTPRDKLLLQHRRNQAAIAGV